MKITHLVVASFLLSGLLLGPVDAIAKGEANFCQGQVAITKVVVQKRLNGDLKKQQLDAINKIAKKEIGNSLVTAIINVVYAAPLSELPTISTMIFSECMKANSSGNLKAHVLPM